MFQVNDKDTRMMEPIDIALSYLCFAHFGTICTKNVKNTQVLLLVKLQAEASHLLLTHLAQWTSGLIVNILEGIRIPLIIPPLSYLQTPIKRFPWPSTVFSDNFEQIFIWWVNDTMGSYRYAKFLLRNVYFKIYEPDFSKHTEV